MEYALSSQQVQCPDYKPQAENQQSSIQSPLQVLENVSSTKYLGVTLQHNAKFDQHIDAVVAKTNRTLGFLRHNFRIGESNIKAQAYKSLVCPILEYSCTVSDPAAQKDIDRLEAVQRRAARFALTRHQRTASVKLMMRGLALPGTPPKDSTPRHAVYNQQRPRSSQVPTPEAAAPKSPAYLHFREDTLPY